MEKKEIYQYRETLFWKTGMQSSMTMSAASIEQLEKKKELDRKHHEEGGKIEMLIQGKIEKVVTTKEFVTEEDDVTYFVDKTTNKQIPKDLRKK